jgi:hypothetical protein
VQDVCGGSDHANIVEEVERAQATVIENSKILRGLWVKVGNAGLILSRVCDSCQLGVYFGVFTFGCGSRDEAPGENNLRPLPLL